MNIGYEMVTTARENVRFFNIDFLRFVFVSMMVLYHTAGSMKQTFSINFIIKLSENCSMTGSNVVNAFFIISGFFIFYSFFKKPEQGLKEYIIKRLFRLWPVLIFSLLICLLIGEFNRYDILNIFFISDGIGFVKQASHNAASWFVCALLFLSIFYAYILKYLNTNTSLFVCSIIAFFGLIILGNAETGFYAHIIYKPLLLTTGMVRGLTFIATGIILGKIALKQNLNIQESFFSKFVFTILEFCLLGCFLYYSVFHLSNFKADIYYQLLFIGVFLSFIYNKGLLSKLCNTKTLARFGNYAFSIYLIHFPVISLCRKFVYEHFSDKFCIVTTVLLCILLGIIVYYFIEEPATKFLTNKYAKCHD